MDFSFGCKCTEASQVAQPADLPFVTPSPDIPFIASQADIPFVAPSAHLPFIPSPADLLSKFRLQFVSPSAGLLLLDLSNYVLFDSELYDLLSVAKLYNLFYYTSPDRLLLHSAKDHLLHHPGPPFDLLQKEFQRSGKRQPSEFFTRCVMVTR